MEKNIANELRKLDIEIGKKLFSISKAKNIPEPPSPLQGEIIDYLVINQKKGVNQRDLEKALNISKATISGTLLAMEKNNSIQRNISKEDARIKKIELTEDSIRIHENMKMVFEDLTKQLTNNISRKELNTFYNILEKLRKNIQTYN